MTQNWVKLTPILFVTFCRNLIKFWVTFDPERSMSRKDTFRVTLNRVFLECSFVIFFFSFSILDDDILPRYYCCSQSRSYYFCYLYSLRRPPATCSGYRRPWLGKDRSCAQYFELFRHYFLRIRSIYPRFS